MSWRGFQVRENTLQALGALRFQKPLPSSTLGRGPPEDTEQEGGGKRGPWVLHELPLTESAKLWRESVSWFCMCTGQGEGAWDLNSGCVLHQAEHQLGTWTQADLSSNLNCTITLRFIPPPPPPRMSSFYLLIFDSALMSLIPSL